MRGRPITNTSAQAQYKREWMRRQREAQKLAPAQYNPQPLAKAMAQWRAQ